MCLTSDKPIEIKVVVDKPLIFYKILREISLSPHENLYVPDTCTQYQTSYRKIEVKLGELTKKNNGPGLLIKFSSANTSTGYPTYRRYPYTIEEGLHGYVSSIDAYHLVKIWNINGSFPYTVVRMELPIGTNYAIGKDNGEAPAVVADRAIYRKIEPKKVKKWEIIVNPNLPADGVAPINNPVFASREAAEKMLLNLYQIREVEVEDE